MSDDLLSQNNNPPQSPNDNTVDPVQSWVAQHEPRGEHGHFVKSDHVTNNQPLQNPSTQNGGFPPPLQVTQNTKYSEKNDPPLVAVSVTNPVTYLKLFLKRLLKNEGIDIHIKIKPLTVIVCILALSTAFGAGFNVAQMFFPTSSPLLHRAITLQGVIQQSAPIQSGSETGQFFLSLPDGSLWTLKPIPPISLNSLTLLINKNVLVKGNLTAEQNVIEVKEILAFEKLVPGPIMYIPNQTSATSSAQLIR